MNKQVDIENSLQEISNFIFTSKYARFNEKKGRRETWEEAVNRVLNMHLKKYNFLSEEDKNEIKWAFDLVRQKRVVPSLRTMQFGGKAVEVKNMRAYNCAVRHIDSLRSFAECFHALLCGSGVGFGLSKQFLNRLPNLVGPNDKTGTIIPYIIEDTIEGWADSVEALLSCYFKNTPYSGRKIVFDFSRIRKKGTPLKIGGGKAPGYKGLKNALSKIKHLLDHIIEFRLQTRLRSIDAYDILMHCADAVLSGGVRRSATIAVFEKDDEDMMNAKTNVIVDKVFSFDEISNEVINGIENKIYEGKVIYEGIKYEIKVKEYELDNLKKKKEVSWMHINPQRARSNNSVLLLRSEVSKQDFEKIIDRTRQFGEPGFIFANDNRALYNPCVEVGFLPLTEDGVCGFQVCNLTSINGRLTTTEKEFAENIKASSLIGTLQAGYTDFDYMSPAAKKLTEEEALLGCSVTGMMDNPDIILNPEIQTKMAKIAVETNEIWAKKIGINPATRTTLTKPEGTSSLLLGTGSGIHPHHARKYFRRVQCNKLDPVYKLFKSINPHACEKSVWSANDTDDVVTFPIEVSDTAIIKSDLSALKHLEIIKSTQQHWVDPGTTKHNKKDVKHSVSCTVIVDEHEWDDVINYLYENRNYFTAVSLLPKIGDKLYAQAPMEAVITSEDEERWNYLKNNMKSVDYKSLIEEDDNTNLIGESACAGGACEIIKT